jgi:hypothetical protein
MHHVLDDLEGFFLLSGMGMDDVDDEGGGSGSARKGGDRFGGIQFLKLAGRMLPRGRFWLIALKNSGTPG